jgi:hypothetical protein
MALSAICLVPESKMLLASNRFKPRPFFQFQRGSSMNLKHALILTELTIALTGAIVANAADEKPVMEEKAEKAQPAQKDKRHDHAGQNKQGAAGKAEDMCCRDPSQAGKKPSHDHRENNK